MTGGISMRRTERPVQPDGPRRRRPVSAVLPLLAVLACGDDPAGPPGSRVDPPRPATVSVTPATLEFKALGDTVRFAAEVRDQHERIMDGATITWSSSDAMVVTVDTAGLVTAVGDGAATVRATVGPVSGDARVTVARAVAAVAVTPSSRAVSVGDTLRLVADAVDENGSSLVGAVFHWLSTNVSVAMVDSSGLVHAVGVGGAMVTATAGTASGSASITVTSADTDRASLVALYEAADGPNWKNTDNWLTDAPLDDWYGVTADSEGRVLELELSGNGLAGAIPSELGYLARLTSLKLTSGEFAGGIPRQLGALSSLRRLHLWGNRLDGPIPPELGNLSRLEELVLAANHLAGSIPPELGKLAKLRLLGLDRNDLEGSVPPELGNLWRLHQLYLHRNRLGGSFPRAFLQLANVRFLSFARNDGLCAPGTAEFITWMVENPGSTSGLDGPNGPFCNSTDVRALVALYEAATGGDWLRSDGWVDTVAVRGDYTVTAALDQWYGVSADSLGRVLGLDLSRNGLSGRLPPELRGLSEMTEFRIGGNALSGPLPVSLAILPIRVFHYAGTELCTPVDAAFRDWIAAIPSHDGPGIDCTSASYRYALDALYQATGGPNWDRSDNWLTDAPLGEWYGVQTDAEGRIAGLSLDDNRLSGHIPGELGDLAHLSIVSLDNNELEGELPPRLGNLARLRRLSINNNGLTGSIPPELGDLRNLRELRLSGNRLRDYPHEIGKLPYLEVLDLSRNLLLFAVVGDNVAGLSNLRVLDLSENQMVGVLSERLGELSSLEVLKLNGNSLWGSIPSELGSLSGLRVLDLRGNPIRRPYLNRRLQGAIPAELGNLSSLEVLNLRDNSLEGIPPELGSLTKLQSLDLGNSDLRGAVPPELGALTSLERLDLADNRMLAGPLPGSLTVLHRLTELLVERTRLCAPADPAFLIWLEATGAANMPACTGSTAYLTQAVQSLAFPVRLVAGEPALLRVFVTAPDAAGESMPPIRARFYSAGTETHVVDIPARSTAIPSERDESSLDASANGEIPGWVIQPGLEMVVEIDPYGTLDPGLGVVARIPAAGRARVDVGAPPALDLTLIPFLDVAAPDSSILDLTDGLTGADDLFWGVRTLLPVGDLDVTVHAPVATATNYSGPLAMETEAIRILEGGTGHYMGTMAGSTIGRGAAYVAGRSSFSVLGPLVMANQLGHNMSLHHAPCGTVSWVDPAFPNPDGSIGVWGYDFRNDTLVPPGTPDLMSECGPPKWISEYDFTKAFRHRLEDEGQTTAAAVRSGSPARALLLWGGVDEEGAPFLHPAFVVDASPSPPSSGGEYRVSGRAADGRTLFSPRVDMLRTADGDGPAGFVFALPVQPDWADLLASITLSGPGGSVTLDGETDRPAAIVRDPLTGQVRGLLRDLPYVSRSSDTAALAAALSARLALEPGLEVLMSLGLPAPGSLETLSTRAETSAPRQRRRSDSSAPGSNSHVQSSSPRASQRGWTISFPVARYSPRISSIRPARSAQPLAPGVACAGSPSSITSAEFPRATRTGEPGHRRRAIFPARRQARHRRSRRGRSRVANRRPAPRSSRLSRAIRWPAASKITVASGRRASSVNRLATSPALTSPRVAS